MANKPNPADFSPELSGYSGVGKFKAWVQMVLPQVYDDALSYQELVYKMLFYINTLIDDVDSVETNVSALRIAYDNLQEYVNDWFDSVDVQEEVNEKLDQYVSDGTLSALIQPLFDAYKTTIDTAITTQNQDIALLKSRMDTFASLPDGSTAGDAELLDIRVAWDGETYSSAGNAVRGQCEQLHDGIELLDGYDNPFDLTDESIQNTSFIINADGVYKRSGSNFKCYIVDRSEYWNSIKIKGTHFLGSNYNFLSLVTFCKGTLPTAPTPDTSASDILCTGETGSHDIYFDETVTLNIPDDCTKILIGKVRGGTDITPQSVVFLGRLSLAVGEVNNEIDNVVNDTIITLAEYPYVNTAIMTAEVTVGSTTTQTSIFKRSASNYRSYQIPVESGWKNISLKGCFGSLDATSSPTTHYSSIAFVKQVVPYAPGDDSSAAEYMCTDTPLRFDIGSLETKTLVIPTDCKYILITVHERGADVTPTNVKILAYLTETSEIVNTVYDYVKKDFIPDYYITSDYLEDKIRTILANRDTMSSNSDSFLLIADHHSNTPQQVIDENLSGRLIDYISERTGITKLVNVGDSGGSSHSTDKYASAINTLKAIDNLDKNIRQSYFILGNHEWNTVTGDAEAKYSVPAVLAYFVEQYKTAYGVVMDAATGNYYFDNPVNKIRYFCLQVDGSATPLNLVDPVGTAMNSTVGWFANELLNVPEDYTVVTFMHYVYIPPRAWCYETDIDPESATAQNFSYQGSTRFISQLLKTFKNKGTITLTNNYPSTYDYSVLTGNRYVALLIGGHKHHGFLYMSDTNISGTDAEQTQLMNNCYGVPTFSAGTDADFSSYINVNGHAWYWEDGIINGTKVERLPDTVESGLFYVVQIDVSNQVFKITAIGGDNDYTGNYGE